MEGDDRVAVGQPLRIDAAKHVQCRGETFNCLHDDGHCGSLTDGGLA